MTTPDTLERLRAANPAVTREEDGRDPVARAALARILAGDGASGKVPPPRRRVPRGLALVLAALVVGAGAAVAATDPFGWRSSNPSSAQYRVNPALHVRTPKAQEITCRPAAAGFRCRPGLTGQTYIQGETIPAPAHGLTRARFEAGLERSLANGTATPAQAKRFRADLAAVPDSFFTELELASRYVTYGGGTGRVPPPGVPAFLVCEDAARALACQNLNGDENAPVGAAIYQALPARDWRPGPSRQSFSGLPPGITFTRAEYRVLFDLLKTARAVHSSGPRATPVAHPGSAPRARVGHRR